MMMMMMTNSSLLEEINSINTAITTIQILHGAVKRLDELATL
jgi:hypothetical protein